MESKTKKQYSLDYKPRSDDIDAYVFNLLPLTDEQRSTLYKNVVLNFKTNDIDNNDINSSTETKAA